ncbi:MAG: 30S ribosomal protein S9 [Candidatus Parcubacteria bacterium]|nr:30S ribosomal protein S9 [Candidatus Parcubacteria bacterium]
MAKIKTDSKYFEAKGRRKTSTARVRFFSGGDSSFLVNDKKLEVYFPTKELQSIAEEPLKKIKIEKKFKISAKIKGGGIHSQAEALRHGISRALIKFNSEFRKNLKTEGFLTRDSRMKERRKFGLKKARKAPQWSKR